MDASLRDELKAFTTELAFASGELIMRYWRGEDMHVERKADSTPVTDADRGAEQLMRKMIAERYPAHGIIAEEFGNERENAEFVWVLDPIDGTKSFISHVPLFGTLIALLHKGEPVLGCIHQPVLGELLIGDNETCILNGSPTRVRPCPDLSKAVISTTDPALFAQGKHHVPGLDRLAEEAWLTRSWGDCYGYLLVATGRVDLMLDPVLETWDLMALIPIIRGAGGVITDWYGNEPTQGRFAEGATGNPGSRSAVVAGPEVHRAALGVLLG
ncbi:histidinol-phosphatase [Ruficoccus amylovorans]|uniref:Histidinol-phosphatase n=1 Tax=Ruficoccus amylovorans TaxID=1804625 RepID=A0A842HCA0_9BACT|nr:histidinol-phosphatase [Ruficoccus amylovorans]MBC2593031.1 histidinol-phosphatase [Ruficoccus amylovorans]